MQRVSCLGRLVVFMRGVLLFSMARCGGCFSGWGGLGRVVGLLPCVGCVGGAGAALFWGPVGAPESDILFDILLGFFGWEASWVGSEACLARGTAWPATAKTEPSMPVAS